jgi:hypothetical protein
MGCEDGRIIREGAEDCVGLWDICCVKTPEDTYVHKANDLT